MANDKFSNNELCDGENCYFSDSCVRFISNVDLESDIINPWVIFNTIPRPKGCEDYLEEDNGFYPQIDL